MKKRMQYITTAMVTVALLTAISAATQAGIVYDNSTTFLGDYYSAATEFGDQVSLSAAEPLERSVTEFKFEYYLSMNASGNEQAELRFYENNGPAVGLGNAPGTLLYSSGPFSLLPGYNNAVASGMRVDVPSTFTWTVLFSGIDASEQIGLLFYDPPTVGSSFDDYWEKSGETWAMKQFTPTDGPVANFGAQITAVPEPSTVLSLLAGLVCVGFAAYRRRSV